MNNDINNSSRRDLKKRIFDIIQIGLRTDVASRTFDYVLVFMILVNILVMVLETYDRFKAYSDLFGVIEIVCIAFFSL